MCVVWTKQSLPKTNWKAIWVSELAPPSMAFKALSIFKSENLKQTGKRRFDLAVHWMGK